MRLAYGNISHFPLDTGGRSGYLAGMVTVRDDEGAGADVVQVTQGPSAPASLRATAGSSWPAADRAFAEVERVGREPAGRSIPAAARPWVVELLADREHAGWTELVNVTQAIARRVGIIDEDERAEVVLRVYVRLGTWRGSTREALFGWIAVVARNVGADVAKTRRAQKRGHGWTRVHASATGVEVLDVLPARHWSAVEVQAGLLAREVLDALPDELAPVAAGLLSGASVADVAQATGLTPSGAEKRRASVRRAVAEMVR